MKLSHCLALMALIIMIVVTSINCVQNTTTPQPTLAPGATPTPVPMPAGSLTWDQQLSIYNTAIQDPYVRDRMVRTAWRNTEQVDDQLVTNLSYIMGEVGYMRFHEAGPGYERDRILPAAEIIPGNASQSGINLLAFVDPDRKKVAYIGFVPRPGVPPAPGVTFSSTDGGLDEYEPTWDTHRYYNNVTVVDTGFQKGMSLSQDQRDQAIRLALANATVQGYVGSYQAVPGDFNVYSYEAVYPYHYLIAYPMLTVYATEGGGAKDTIYVMTDLVNNKVFRVEHGNIFLF
jgi:hypothetical protein